MKKENKNLISFVDHLDKQYGKRGTTKREKYEEEFEAFKLGVMLQELRKDQGLTQEQVADKCGTTKTYISRKIIISKIINKKGPLNFHDRQ